MKKLIIMRHGKSDWTDNNMDDFDRYLTIRGIENAKEMGNYIFSKEGKPELIISSSAKRAFETAVLCSDMMDYQAENIVKEDRFYLASADQILRLLTLQKEDISTLMILGHNPGLTDLVNKLGVGIDNLPTASAVCFEFDTNRWSEINSKNAKFLWIQMARNL